MADLNEHALNEVLERLGYSEFRPGQREAIAALLSEKKLLLVAPTGGGKSLCYQAPALLLGGTTLVISPLIALMNDQVDGLTRRGVNATFLASTLDPEVARERLNQIRRGHYSLVYVAPERLQLEHFQELLVDLDPPLIAIDEAHCISEWGHDFRPEYMRIGELLARLPHAHVMACTATATPVVRDEILARLELPHDTPQIVRGFARPNLALRVEEAASKERRHALVDALLTGTLGGPHKAQGTAIVYAPTRKGTEEEAARLAGQGWRARAYHAGMDGTLRDEVQGQFIRGELTVTVATNAFGMGIDRSDVRAVLHLAPPGSMEAYYQEVGRAGRDGLPACAMLLTSPRDMPLRRNLLERPQPDGQPPPAAVIEHKWNLFLELMRWSEGGTCRHDAILRYFGDEKETLQGCGRCDVCQALERGEGADDAVDADEVQLLVRKALSGIARIHGRFGLTAAVQLLRGQKDARLERTGLTRLSTFGILNDHNESYLLALLRRCVTAGWIDFTSGQRPVVMLTDAGKQVMKAQLPARILLPSTERAPEGSRGTRGRSVAAASAPTLDAAATRLFDALREHRMARAKAAQVPPYVIASDRTLRDLATLRPRNVSELRQAHGIGEAKAEKFGAGFLQIIA